MKKAEKKLMNELCERAYDEAMVVYKAEHYGKPWARLYTCSADYCRLGKFIYLRSYSTVVAIIDTELNECYDVLRMVYGYTATSAQHIAKFYNKFSRELPCQPNLLRWYDL